MATMTTSAVTTPQTTVLSEKLMTSTSTTFQTSAKFSWEQGPMSLIPTPASQAGEKDQWTHVASEMALVHNCIIRALNSIYLQAPFVPTREHQNFLAYAHATYLGLTMHHDGEEEMFFPELEKRTGEKGLMESNVQGHRDFDKQFDTWGKWLERCMVGSKDKKEAEQFDASECRAMMNSFMPPLSEHLAAEIPTLLDLRRFPDLDLRQTMADEGEKIMGSMSKTDLLPLFFVNHDVLFEGGIHNFPPVPAPVKFVLSQVFGRWQSAWWQFATCGLDGKPRELKYLK